LRGGGRCVADFPVFGLLTFGVRSAFGDWREPSRARVPCAAQAAGSFAALRTALQCSVLRPRRETPAVRCAHFGQTVATSLLSMRAARAGRKTSALRRRRFALPGTRARLGRDSEHGDENPPHATVVAGPRVSGGRLAQIKEEPSVLWTDGGGHGASRLPGGLGPSANLSELQLSEKQKNDSTAPQAVGQAERTPMNRGRARRARPPSFSLAGTRPAGRTGSRSLVHSARPGTHRVRSGPWPVPRPAPC